MTVVIDTSAVIAMLMAEPVADSCAAALFRHVQRMISAASYVEAGTVLAGRIPAHARSTTHEVLDVFLSEHDIRIIPVTDEQARIALKARVRYGRGFGSPANLNYGDCFAYALAKAENAKLLYLGEDFSKTDIEAALSPRP